MQRNLIHECESGSTGGDFLIFHKGAGVEAFVDIVTQNLVHRIIGLPPCKEHSSGIVEYLKLQPFRRRQVDEREVLLIGGCRRRDVDIVYSG